MAKAIVTTDEVDVKIDLSGLGEVLEGLFNQHPAAQGDINKAWGMIKVMGAQMESLGKTIGSLNRLVVLLKEQRDELLEDNAKQWDEGYRAGERIARIGVESDDQDTMLQMFADHIVDATLALTSPEIAEMFAEALRQGELTIDEGEALNDVVRAIAQRFIDEQEGDTDGQE
jgi:hypothetical protein